MHPTSLIHEPGFHDLRAYLFDFFDSNSLYSTNLVCKSFNNTIKEHEILVIKKAKELFGDLSKINNEHKKSPKLLKTLVIEEIKKEQSLSRKQNEGDILRIQNSYDVISFLVFPHITQVIINHTAIQSIPVNLWNSIKIETLTISNSKISHLSNDIGKLKNVSHLDLSGNQIQHVPSSLISLAKKKKLFIDLTENPCITKLCKNYLELCQQQKKHFYVNIPSGSVACPSCIHTSYTKV